MIPIFTSSYLHLCLITKSQMILNKVLDNKNILNQIPVIKRACKDKYNKVDVVVSSKSTT